MKKLIVRWVALALFLVALALVFVRLGDWQLDRLDQRRDANARMEQLRSQPVMDYREVMGGTVTGFDEWQRVHLTGVYEPGQYQVRYRNHQDSPGIEVVAVITTTDGDKVLANRGFIPRQAGQPDTSVLPEPPDGQVTVTGYVRRSESGASSAITPNDYRVRLINTDAIAGSRGEEILDGYVSLIGSVPDNGEATIPMEPTPLDEGNHYSYALQWFAFSVIALGGIVVLVRADLKDLRKAKRQAAVKQAREAGRSTAGSDA